MIWIVSKGLVNSDSELTNRHEVIQEISATSVTLWSERVCSSRLPSQPQIEFYQCVSKKGEYGVIITAHINEVQPILQSVLSGKRALVIINSCGINSEIKMNLLQTVLRKNVQSEVYFAKQNLLNSGLEVNFVDNIGTFGYPTSAMERSLYKHRKCGLIKAIRIVCDRIG